MNNMHVKSDLLALNKIRIYNSSKSISHVPSENPLHSTGSVETILTTTDFFSKSFLPLIKM